MSFVQSVKVGDPDRYMAAMRAPQSVRQHLMVLFAFNLEIARAPWASAEPMIAEMRLQWWLDAIGDIYEGRGARGHEMLAPLAVIINAHALPRLLFEQLIEARRFDIYSKPHTDRPAFDTYIDETSAHLMVLAGQVLSVTDTGALRRVGHAVGVANILRAAPELWARGRNPLLAEMKGPIDRAINDLNVKTPKGAFPVVLTGWRARSTLKMALARPERIKQGLLEESPAWRHASYWKCRLSKKI